MDIRRIGVLGAGAMGHGIAQVAAQAGYETTLCDVDAPLLDAALSRIRENLEKGVARGKVEPQVAEATVARIDTTTDLEKLAASSDLIIEAIPENLELKQQILSRLEAAAAPEAMLASNTSSLSIGAIATALERPDRFLGMHFFNPVHIMKLVELVSHDGSGPEVVSAAREVAESMHKTPIIVRDSPGFATSRLGVALGLEAMRMVEQGVASATDIDTAMELGYRHPMGPLRLTDLVGLDVRLAIAEYLHAELGTEAFDPPEILRRYVTEGRLGKKSGRGFYDWTEQAAGPD